MTGKDIELRSTCFYVHLANIAIYTINMIRVRYLSLLGNNYVLFGRTDLRTDGRVAPQVRTYYCTHSRCNRSTIL